MTVEEYFANIDFATIESITIKSSVATEGFHEDETLKENVENSLHFYKVIKTHTLSIDNRTKLININIFI